MSNRFIKFIYDKTLKRPKKIAEQRFCTIFARKNMIATRIKLQIIATCVLLPSFSKNGLKLENCQYISVHNNINILINL